MSYHQTIYNLLRGYGLSEAGALGMLGNWECESGCEPYRVQGDYQASRAISKAYVDAIESGRMSKEQFATDQKGFGLAQWTYPQRKRNLWDRAKNSIYRIDYCEFQVEFAILELSSEYSGLLSYLKTAEAIWDCTDRICREYERPAVNNVQARYEAALRIRKELDLSGAVVVEDNATIQEAEVLPYKPELIPATECWPPRMVDKNMDGDDVVILKAVLSARGFFNQFSADSSGYLDGQTDKFDDDTEKAVKHFQAAYKLDVDGVVGPKTWAKLLEV